jgi:GDPmannose 4,6-dehydratase
MTKKKALITGVFGQDGIFLSRLLLSKDYVVIGTYSRDSANKFRNQQFLPNRVKLIEINYHKPQEIQRVLEIEKPDEMYNFNALSSVQASFVDPSMTKVLNELNPISTFNFIKKRIPELRVYQAGSSEMFGFPKSSPQNESTEFSPQSPYANTKLNTFNQVVQLRNLGLFAVNGIMYNHESEYRSETFVSRKVSQNIARILLKKQDRFSLGDLSVVRDWGYAEDYVTAMWQMLQHSIPQDYVIATGKSRSLRDYVNEALDIAGLDGNADEWVRSDPTLYRTNEITNLTGDFTRANIDLGWKPTTPFRTWVGKMLENDYKIESKNDV